MFISCFNPELLISKNEISLLFVIQVIVRKRMNDDNKLITMKGNFVHVGDSEFSLNFLRNWKSHHVAIVVRALQCVPTARTSSFFLEEKKKKALRHPIRNVRVSPPFPPPSPSSGSYVAKFPAFWSELFLEEANNSSVIYDVDDDDE